MDQTAREQMRAELEALRRQVQEQGAASPELLEHMHSLERLLSDEQQESFPSTTARKLEQRFLAWEAEHPKVVAFATRVARALEDSGL